VPLLAGSVQKYPQCIIQYICTNILVSTIKECPPLSVEIIVKLVQ
jgi:hypothetical protein